MTKGAIPIFPQNLQARGDRSISMDFTQNLRRPSAPRQSADFGGAPRAMADALSAASEQIHVAQAARFQFTRSKLSDKMKRPGRGVHACLKAWPNHNHGDPSMVEASSSVSHACTKYWVDVILTTAWECRRFESPCLRPSLRLFAQR